MRFSKVILTVFCIALIPMAASAVSINEIRIDQGGTDYNEYFELLGSPSESLNGLTYIVIGDGATGSGTIESVTDLSGNVIAADSYFLVTESSWFDNPEMPTPCGDAPDLMATLGFENSDNVTHMLVSGFTGAIGDDIDTNDDGNIDNPLWSSIVDCVALIESVGSGDLVYCNKTIGPDGSFVPAHVLICDSYWNVGDFTFCMLDSPGVDNVDICVVGTDDTSFGSLKALFR